MNIESQRLKKFLVDAELVSAKDFDKAMEFANKNNKKIGDVLVSKELVKQENLAKLQAYLAGVPFVSIGQETIPPEVLKIIPEPIARAHNIIAFRKRGSILEVAMLDPEDLVTIEFIEKSDPFLKVLPCLTTAECIKAALRQYQKNLEAEFGEMAGEESYHKENDSGGYQAVDDGFDKSDEMAKAARELPTIRVVDTLIKHAILQKASDVHIEPQEKEVIVRFRIDGILRDVMAFPLFTAQGIIARIKVLSNLKLDEHRLPQDGRFKIENNDYKYSVRVSILPVFNGEKIVMRLLAENTKVQGLEDLGFAGKNLKIITSSLAKPTGMILITGPTGSGKTTTLYTMMDILNKPSVNISTIEDPIEYRMPRINQTQVHAQIGLTFASGLRALVRQDPNIIMVGEIRDTETAGLAINAALTGHLVLSTLHTTGAAGAIPRIIDMKVEPFLIASTLNIIIAQRLVRKFSGRKEKYRFTKKEIENLAKYCNPDKILEILKKEKMAKQKDSLEDVTFFRPESSGDISGGYKGRVGIYEVLPISENMKDLIVKKAPTKEIISQADQEGMITMVEDGFIKAAQGITSIEEVLRVIMD